MNIGILLREPFHKLVEELHVELAKRGHPEIRPAHGNVFQFIGRDGARVTDMAKRAQMTKQSMSYLVYDLETKGYVERLPDPQDGRALIFRCTAKGRAVTRMAEAIIERIHQRWIKDLGPKRAKLLWELLTELNEKA